VRYLKVTILIGLAVSAFVAVLCAAGALNRLDVGLWSFLGRVHESPLRTSPVQYPLIVLLAFGIAWSTVDINRPSLKVLVAFAALAEIIALPWVLNMYRHFFSPFPGALAVLLAFGAGFAYSRSDAGMRKRTLRSVFGDRVSDKIFTTLVNSDQPLKFDGALVETTVVVCEIFNHDVLSESMPVADSVAMTNEFLDVSAEFLVERGGYLDECDGESLRVIFGAPIEDEKHASRACEAALQLAQRMENLNLECQAKWHNTFDFRIGVNSGEVVAAAYGSKRLGSFSVAGETIEFARRLCSANMIYGSRIMLGPETYLLASGSVEVRPVELIRGRAGNARDEVYELLAMKNTLSAEALEKRDLFWKGVVYYREQKWENALEHFQSALTLTTSDALVEFYIRRIEHLRTGTPTQHWDNAKI
jgi:adenylate cyclase